MKKINTLTAVRTLFVLAFSIIAVLSTTEVSALGSIPSPTDVAIPSDASKVFKVHSWNVLNVAKDTERTYRADFSMDVADDAWSTENITILSLQEICKSSVEQFAADNGVPAANYVFLDYKGAAYTGSSATAYDADVASCQTESGDSGDDYGLAIISRGEVLNSSLIRNTGAGLYGYGERGIACIKTRYLERVLASCGVHTQFDNNATDKLEVTRQQMIQNEANTRAFAENTTPAADYIFLPGDYNLSPADPISNPGLIMNAQWHGHNTDFSFPTTAPDRRIDHIYFSKNLSFLTTDTPVCSGPGIVTATSTDDNPTGDHCYIGAVAYETSTAQAAAQAIPGVPNAGEQSYRVPQLTILFGSLTVITLVTLYRRKKSFVKR